jgi:hypothetical protein
MGSRPQGLGRNLGLVAEVDGLGLQGRKLTFKIGHDGRRGLRVNDSRGSWSRLRHPKACGNTGSCNHPGCS